MQKNKLIRMLDIINRNSADKIWKIRERANDSKGIAHLYYTYRYYSKLEKVNSEIPLSAYFESTPVFPHGIKGIFVSSGAKIGRNCVIFQQVTIGSNTIKDSQGFGAPCIGNNVFIGAGAKIVGGVHIGNNVRIGANCIVVCDIPENCTVVLEKPRIIQHNDSLKLDNSFSKFAT